MGTALGPSPQNANNVSRLWKTVLAITVSFGVAILTCEAFWHRRRWAGLPQRSNLEMDDRAHAQ